MSANACSSVTRRTTLGRDVEFAPSRTGRSVRTDRMVAAADDRELAVAAISGYSAAAASESSDSGGPCGESVNVLPM